MLNINNGQKSGNLCKIRCSLDVKLLYDFKLNLFKNSGVEVYTIWLFQIQWVIPIPENSKDMSV